MIWKPGESLKYHSIPGTTFRQSFRSKERCVSLRRWQTARLGEGHSGWGFCRWAGVWSWPNWDCSWVPCPLARVRSAAELWHDDRGKVLSSPLLPHAPERAWASNSKPRPMLVGLVPVPSCVPGGGGQGRKTRAEKREKGEKRSHQDHLSLPFCSDVIPNFHKRGKIVAVPV